VEGRRETAQRNRRALGQTCRGERLLVGVRVGGRLVGLLDELAPVAVDAVAAEDRLDVGQRLRTLLVVEAVGALLDTVETAARVRGPLLTLGTGLALCAGPLADRCGEVVG